MSQRMRRWPWIALLAAFGCALALPIVVNAIDVSDGVAAALAMTVIAAGVAAGLVIREQHL
jgi:hypothetical protein